MKKSQLHGKRVTCKIDGVGIIKDAKLSIDKNCIYVCQNVYDGCPCKEKIGYKYSYVFADKKDIKQAKDLSDLNGCGISDLKFVGTRGRKKKTSVGAKILKETDQVPEFSIENLLKPSPENNYLDLTKDNKEQVILILLEEGYKVWEKEGLLYFERVK